MTEQGTKRDGEELKVVLSYMGQECVESHYLSYPEGERHMK